MEVPIVRMGIPLGERMKGERIASRARWPASCGTPQFVDNDISKTMPSAGRRRLHAGRAAVSRVPACGHVAAAVSRVPRQRGHAMTYAAHAARQRGLAMRSPFLREIVLRTWRMA